MSLEVTLHIGYVFSFIALLAKVCNMHIQLQRAVELARWPLWYFNITVNYSYRPLALIHTRAGKIAIGTYQTR